MTFSGDLTDDYVPVPAEDVQTLLSARALALDGLAGGDELHIAVARTRSAAFGGADPVWVCIDDAAEIQAALMFEAAAELDADDELAAAYDAVSEALLAHTEQSAGL